MEIKNLCRTNPAELVSFFCRKEVLYLFVCLQFCLNCLVKFPGIFRHVLSSTKKTVSATLRQMWLGMLQTEEGVWQLLSWETGWSVGMLDSWSQGGDWEIGKCLLSLHREFSSNEGLGSWDAEFLWGKSTHG